METNDLTLRAKLAQKKNMVIGLVSNIEKTGKNTMQGYKYAEEVEVVRHIRNAFETAKISFGVSTCGIEITHQITTKNGQVPHIVVKLACTLTDTETGYCEVSPWYGAAFDSGDKAFYKAYTSGVKYFLMKTFLLPTGDDVEADDPQEKPKLAAKPAPKPAATDPTDAQKQITQEVLKKLNDTALSQNLTIDPDKVKNIVLMSKKSFPTYEAKAKAIVDYILDEKQGGIKRVCAA